MGYDVHITRKIEWSDEDGPCITEDEWRAYVASDSELVITGSAECKTPQGETVRISQPLMTEWRHHSSRSPVWLSYFEGNLSIKNPDEECRAKMRQIAAKLQAKVQGDDGEYYEGSEAPRQPQISLGSRVAGWFSKRRPNPQPKIEHEPLPFAVGDRVFDAWGFEHTITSIDPKAHHGMGMIRSRRSSDGTEHSYALIAHGFKTVTKK
jgi:hypothetical protein